MHYNCRAWIEYITFGYIEIGELFDTDKISFISWIFDTTDTFCNVVNIILV